MIYFTSDTHFNHDSIRKHCNRPWDSVEEMDKALIDNWNKCINPGDTVYHLGDFAFGGHEIVKNYRNKLNGKVHLILGNHDYRNRIHNIEDLFSSTNNMLTLKYNHEKIVLCHYPMRSWDSSCHGSYQLYGHSHGLIEPIGKQMDVGVDANGYMPLSITQVMQKLLITGNKNEDEREKDENITCRTKLQD